MKRILTTTTALSVALSTFGPLPVVAQTTLEIEGQAVICLPNKKAECPEGAFCVVAIKPENCERNALKALKEQADAAAIDGVVIPDANAAPVDQAAADAAAAEKAAADAVATEQAAAEKAAADAVAAEQAAAEKAAADAVAAEQAVAEKAAADAVAAEQAAAEKAAADAVAAEQAAAEKAAAEAVAAEQAAAEKAAAEAAAAEQAVADKAAAEAAAAEQAAAEKAAAEAVAAEQAAAEKAAAEAAAAEQAVADKAAAEAAAAEQAAAEKAAAEATAAEQAAAEKAAAEAVAAEQAAAEKAAEPVAETPAVVEPSTESPADGAVAEEVVPTEPLVPTAPELVLAPAEGVEAPKEAAVTSLTDILSENPDAGTDLVAPAAAAETDITVDASDRATVTEVTAEDSRASTQDFATTAAPTAASETAPQVGRKREKLSDLEKFGLVVLGALVVGAVLNNGDKVVANTGDRVVMQRDDGRYVVLKDDDTLIRRPGSTVKTETYEDGSTRSVVEREDGSKIVTIRDASGRVLRRARVDADGRQTLLIDDLTPVERIDVTTLPKPREGGLVVGTNGNDAALRAALLAVEAGEAGRSFSLRQIREYPQVRALAPTIDVENVTFDSGSAAIDVTEAKKLAKLGRLMADLIHDNPAELFLIEGHTDAVGSGSSNLALSDRRAESLALALTEYYGVPPENMVIQGYGETELRVNTMGDEVRNRRAAVRMISPLMQKLAGN